MFPPDRERMREEELLASLKDSIFSSIDPPSEGSGGRRGFEEKRSDVWIKEFIS